MFEFGLLTILQCAHNPAKFFAKVLLVILNLELMCFLTPLHVQLKVNHDKLPVLISFLSRNVHANSERAFF